MSQAKELHCYSSSTFLCLCSCLLVCSLARLPVCLPVCLPACLFVCLSVCLPACLPACYLSFFFVVCYLFSMFFWLPCRCFLLCVAPSPAQCRPPPSPHSSGGRRTPQRGRRCRTPSPLARCGSCKSSTWRPNDRISPLRRALTGRSSDSWQRSTKGEPKPS